MKRHGYYCRARKSGNTTRPRSCLACASRKAKCDKRGPKCSRCLAKGIDCHYPVKAAKVVVPIDSADAVENTEPGDLSPVLPSVDSSPMDLALDQVDGNNHFSLEPDFANLEGAFLDWEDSSLDFTDLLDLKALGPYSPPHPQSITNYPFPYHPQTLQAHHLSPSPTLLSRSLIRRAKSSFSTQRNSNLILHTMKSYPKMILHHNTMPPFIHPYLLTQGVEDDSMEFLSNCISLMHMIGSSVSGSRKLYWRNVRVECEHMCASVGELLSCLSIPHK